MAVVRGAGLLAFLIVILNEIITPSLGNDIKGLHVIPKYTTFGGIFHPSTKSSSPSSVFRVPMSLSTSTSTGTI